MPKLINPKLNLDGNRMATAVEFEYNSTKTKDKVVPIGADRAKYTQYGAVMYEGTLTVVVPDDGPEFDWPTFCIDESSHTLHIEEGSGFGQIFSEVEFKNLRKTIPRDSGEVNWSMDWVASDAN